MRELTSESSASFFCILIIIRKQQQFKYPTTFNKTLAINLIANESTLNSGLINFEPLSDLMIQACSRYFIASLSSSLIVEHSFSLIWLQIQSKWARHKVAESYFFAYWVAFHSTSRRNHTALIDSITTECSIAVLFEFEVLMQRMRCFYALQRTWKHENEELDEGPRISSMS